MKNNIYITIIALQIALLGTILNSIIGINIPILREIIGFVYLTFIPGLLLLIIFRVRNFNFIEWIFYSVCLSISFLMFIGFFMNIYYPFLGISKPISLIPLVITLTFAVSVLLIVAFFQDKNNSKSTYLHMSKPNLNYVQILLLCLLPFLSIFGTYFLNYYDNNVLLIILILIISIIPIIISYDKLQANLYCFALFVIALSLLFHYSLVSGYINGYDIQIEKFLSNQVIHESYWDLNSPGSTNSLASINILAPTYSLITSMDIVWVYKIIYQLIFAFISTGLYILYRLQTNQKIAFLSTFFFMSIFTFYAGMPQLARQEIAELFFVSLLCLIFDDKMSPIKKSVMSVIFIISLVVSHYSLSYIFLYLISIFWLILNLSRERKNNISFNFILLSFVVTLAWYLYTSSSSNLFSISNLFKSIFSNFAEFLNPNYIQGMEIIQSRLTLTREFSKWLHIISQIFITVGLITVFNKKRSIILNTKYKLFLVVSYSICLAGITVPFVSNALNTMRLYHITLIILSPLLVIGGITVLSEIASIAKLNQQNETKYFILLSLFLAVFLLFNSGIVYEITGEEPSYISFNNSIDAPRFTEIEVSAANWINKEKSSNVSVYGDEYMGLLLSGMLGENNHFGEIGGIFYFESNEQLKPELQESAYIFLGEKNVKNDRIFVHTYEQSDFGDGSRDLKVSPLQKMLLDANLVNNDGFSLIYYVTNEK